MKKTEEIEKSKKLAEGFKQAGIDAKFNEETGEILMRSSELNKLKIILDGIRDIQ